MMSVLSSLALVFDLLNYPANFIIGIGNIGRKDVRLTDEKFLFIGTECLPFREAGTAECGLSIRPGRELRISRDHAEPLLVRNNLFAEIVPAFVKQMHVADFLDPLRGRLVRCVRAAGHVIEKERFVGRG
jgi:hypothetical protein